MSNPEPSNPSSITSSSATSSAQELRQKLLRQILEYNTDSNTPPDLRIHITGLTLEEGAVFERDRSPVSDDLGSQAQTPSISPRGAPRGSPSLPPEADIDTGNILSKAPETPNTDPETEAPESREQKIKIRDLKRERETLEMEGRRRAAKEQVDARWKERALKDWKESKARMNYNIGRGADVLREAVLDGDARNGEGDIQRREGASKEEKKKSSPKASNGLKQLAVSRRKANNEWIANEGHRRAERENDEITRNSLLKDVNRAIAVAEGAAWKGGEQFMDFVNGEGSWRNASEVEDKGTNRESRVRDEQALAYPRPGHEPQFPPRVEAESRRLVGRGHGNGDGSPSPEERGRRRVQRTRDTSSHPQELESHLFTMAGVNPQRHHVRANTSDLPESKDGERPPPQAMPSHREFEPVNYADEKYVLIPNVRPAREANRLPFIYSPRTNIAIPPTSPLVMSAAKPQAKPEHPPTPIIFPVPAIRDSRLLPNESPAQWKVRTQRETAAAKFEKTEKSICKEGVSAGTCQNNDEVGARKGIMKREEGKGKEKAIAWADGECIDDTSDDDDLRNSLRKTPSFDERADREELERLEEKRQKREGKYRCLATGSKIERENVAARERAEELAEMLVSGGGGSEDQMQ
ncbi:hypothetical protein NHQ30_005777 [Ciborinia camelliae]|nr:hypothetical protein NHQ30_005777 [Ciborinia camelliae]